MSAATPPELKSDRRIPRASATPDRATAGPSFESREIDDDEVAGWHDTPPTIDIHEF